MYGPVASYANNLAIPIALGCGGSFIAVLYRSRFLPEINENRIKDSFGLIGGFFFPALTGVVVTSPIIIYMYYNYSFVNKALTNVAIVSGAPAQILAFAGISGGIGLICGMFLATIMRCISIRQQ